MTDLSANVEEAWNAKRPLFHRLSEGTCWLISFPYTAPGQEEGRLWYHTMLDSWVWGQVGMLGGWAVGQSFKVEPKYTSFKDIKGICLEIEEITRELLGWMDSAVQVVLDSVIISHFSIDHVAPQVLRAVPPSTPVFASSLAHSTIVALKHFDTIIEFGAYDPSNWKADSSIERLPPWLNLGLLNPPADIAHQTPAVIIGFKHDQINYAIIYALHGIHPKELEPVMNDDTKVLALMCGLTATKTITGHLIAYGGPQALACVRAVKPRWWIKNHDDENVNVFGLIGRALRMDEYTLERVLKEEAGDGEVRGLEETELVDLRQGDSVALVS